MVRLILLAAMGLGSLYMLHILAMDFNRIRKPVTKLAKFLFMRSKRDVGDISKIQFDTKVYNNLNRCDKTLYVNVIY